MQRKISTCFNKMASCSAPSQSVHADEAVKPSSNNTPSIEYDVFVSFHGNDIRWSFLSHLTIAFRRSKINAFVDDRLKTGDDIWLSIVEAIKGSSISLIIFSENYASSRWCLEELVKILECKEKYGRIVIPVFYHVEPSNVRHQRGSYENALTTLGKKYDIPKMQIWRQALNTSANLSGITSLKYPNDADLLEEIINQVQKTIAEKQSYIVEAWGGGGNRWDDGTYTGVREIKLKYTYVIDSILFVYEKEGQALEGDKHGEHGGYYTAVIKLDYPNEFLIGVSGSYGMWRDECIRSLTFKSNLRTFGPYGVEEGKRFTFSSYPIFEIVGFHGTSGEYLNSIGVHLFYANQRNLVPKDELESSTVVVGPWGGTGGVNWDDGSFTGVRSITLFYGICFIDAISVVYDDDGQSLKTEKHGGHGSKETEIILQFPDEFLINVSGHYTSNIRSLTFETNRRTFGPYGVEQGTPFSLSTRGRRILGFKGQGIQYLEAIGFHLSKTIYDVSSYRP